MSRVYLVLPREEIGDGFFFARKCCLQCFSRGETPLNLNFAYGAVLDMNSEQEVAMMQRAAVEWMEVSTRVVCYIDRSIDNEMKLELERARNRGLPIDFRRLAGGRPTTENLHFMGVPHSENDCALCLGPKRMAALTNEERETLNKKKE